jgi:hypothetical protein
MTTRTGGRLSRLDRRMGVACVWKLKSPIIEDHQLLSILASRRRFRETITRLFRCRGRAIIPTRIGGQLSRSDRQMGVACVWKLKSPIIDDHHLLAILVFRETIIQLFVCS